MNKKSLLDSKIKDPKKIKINPTPCMIASFFSYIVFNSKHDPHHTQFEKDLVLFIIEKLVPFFFIESLFLKRLILRQNLHASFPSRHQLMNDIFLRLTKKTKEKFISKKFIS